MVSLTEADRRKGKLHSDVPPHCLISHSAKVNKEEGSTFSQTTDTCNVSVSQTSVVTLNQLRQYLKWTVLFDE